MKISYQIVIFLCLCLSGQIFAQNSIIRSNQACINCPTEEPHPSAVLDIHADDRGLLIPRLANTAAVAAPAAGLMIYDNSSSNYKYYNGSIWQPLGNGEAVDYREFYDYVCTNPQDYQMSIDASTTEDCGTLYDSGGAIGNYGNNENESFTIDDEGIEMIEERLFTRVTLHYLDIEEGADTLFIEGIALTQNITTPIEFFFDGIDQVRIRFVSDASNVGGPYEGFHLSWDNLIFQEGNSVNDTGLGFFYNAEKQTVGGGIELDSSWHDIGFRSVLFGYGGKIEGNYNTSIGYSNEISGKNIIALGNNNDVDGGNGSVSANIAIGERNDVIGNKNGAIGRDNNVDASNSFAIGEVNDVFGGSSVALGRDNDVFGGSSVALGRSNDVDRGSSIALGAFNSADATRSSAIGYSTIADARSMTAIGIYNLPSNGNLDSWVPDEPVFVIGNGQSQGTRSNAMTVLKNGNVGIGTTTPDELLHVDGKIQLGSLETLEDGGGNIIATNSHFLPLVDNQRDLGSSSNRWDEVWATDGTINTSDARDKRSIEDLDYGLAEVLDLRPVRFQWKGEKTGEEKLGLLAQDLLKVLPEVVKSHDWVQVEEDSEELKKVALERYGVFYSDLIPVLIRAIQEQQEEIEELEENFEDRLADLEEQLAHMQQNCCTSTLDVENRSASLLGTSEQAQLLQNEPNPFDQSTTIRYFIPNEAQQASLQISDLTGKIIRQITIKERGSGSHQLDAYSLQAGSYFYTLMIDGQVLETKQMVILK